jgi:hypothetical protein
LEKFAKHIKKIKVADNDMKTPSIFKKNVKAFIFSVKIKPLLSILFLTPPFTAEWR